MKRNLKRLLPILMCIAIVCSLIWYLFVYDRGFTLDMLLAGARHFESKGSYSIATWLYNQAYLQSNHDDDVIIELAERFKKAGNYTQAEVTLSNAIAEGGSVKLYIALCQTYVEQDKLLDATNMLDSITDPEIKAQLDAMRPAAPVASPAPGFYNQYITVTVEQNLDGYLFVSTDGEFPSTVKHPYTGGIVLQGGENTIYAISLSKDGLVSVPAYFGYTIGGVIEDVSIEDPTMDALIRDKLEVTAGVQLKTNDLWKITELTVPKEVESLSDLRHLTQLVSLTIENRTIDSLNMLPALSQLKSLTIRGCPLSATDVARIGSLPNLEDLVLTDCSLTDISGLSSAPKLVTLDLSSNAIRDVTALSMMEYLTSLNLSNNALTNLSALSALTQLVQLDVSYNSLTSLAPLISCSSLAELNASNNKVDEIPVFLNTNVLTLLNLSNNELTSVAPAAKYENLRELYISKNKLTHISDLAVLTKLERIDFSRNEITVLPYWEKSCALITINGSYNQLTSVSALKGLENLNDLILDYNKISNVNPLADCSKLVQVDIFGNPVYDVSSLTKLSIIVNYDPT